MVIRNQFTPDYASPPGETIMDLLEETGGDTIDWLASALNLPLPVINALVEGELIIDEDLAEKLSTLFDVSADFWIRRELNYRQSPYAKEGITLETYLNPPNLPKDKIRMEDTTFGFIFGAVEVARVFSLDKGQVVLTLTTAKGIWQVYVTKTGKLRIFDNQNKELT
jgi:plasmid maintenance system antidote protein VapI